MPRHISLVFPGQGSQSVGMLDDFNQEDFLSIKSAIADLPFDLLDIIKNGPEDIINKTSVTQPALLATSYLHYKRFLSLTNIVPNIIAGHSLGEYSALVVSDSIELKKAISLVHKRGLLMESSEKGSMFAVLNLDLFSINDICKKVSESTGLIVSPANINSPNQIVIAGHEVAAKLAADLCKEAGAKRCIQLKVGAASHCRLMESASKLLLSELSVINFNEPSIPVVHNYDASTETTSINIREKLTNQLTSPVQWIDTMNLINEFNGIIIECGPGKVLSGLAKSNGLDNILSTSSNNFKEEFYELYE
jgi:[acyl-carrier-protein] S-malonyltransferase|tara:strand:+ start:277 stop:1197 length:921 start_codon:yes stop_codon:yes gene_type:complete